MSIAESLTRSNLAFKNYNRPPSLRSGLRESRVNPLVEPVIMHKAKWTDGEKKMDVIYPAISRCLASSSSSSFVLASSLIAKRSRYYFFVAYIIYFNLIL